MYMLSFVTERQEERLLEPPALSFQGGQKRGRDDPSDKSRAARGNPFLSLAMKAGILPSSSASTSKKDYTYMPPHQLCITNRVTSKGRQAVLQIMLPAGLTNKTTERLVYTIEDSIDGSKSILVLEGIMPPTWQNPELVQKAYEEHEKNEDWVRAMQALTDARRERVIHEHDQLKCVARFDLGIKVPAKIKSEWVTFVGHSFGERFLIFIIPELLKEDTYKGPPTKTVKMIQSDEDGA
jgi:hypothetical protein